MPKQFVVVDHEEDWNPYYPSESLITSATYLHTDPSPELPALVINLCRNYKYLGEGYYCSLLAEARGDRVIPSIRTINDLSKRRMYTLGLSSIKKLPSDLGGEDSDSRSLRIYFGITVIHELQSLARQLFDLFPCPILEVTFKRTSQTWTTEQVKPLAINKLTATDQDEFAAALDQFSSSTWRRARRKKRYSYDLAILHDPKEELPPSNRNALKNFITAGHQLGIDAELITKRDALRLTEYDGLFIRETTAVDHHTYQFAQKAEFLNIPVIDDTSSILKCANKVYLTERFRDNDIRTPKTLILHRDNPQNLTDAVDQLGLPLVLKIPDGSFSRGIHKVSTCAELKTITAELFRSSVLVLAQEFMYTDFDWRIGVLGNRPLFACKYYMSAGHWQIYNHAASGSRKSGGFTTMATEQAPIDAIKLAVKAAGLIGSGLYGVDIKQSGDTFSVIEVNDNPNIDAGIEDNHLGKLIYFRVMEHLFSQMELYRYG